MSYLFASKIAARFHFAALLTTPLFLVWMAGMLESARTGPPADWLRVAEFVLLAWAIYALSAPFIIEAIHRRGAIKSTPRLTPEQLILLMGVAAASSVTFFAFFLIAFGGATARHVYVSAPISISAGLFWCWRYRQVLR